ncbi:MAG TPA: glycosyltransferase [Desulfonatronum sp.]|nr:glycosyltransferase [Desulfonatronum sp.]
MNANKPRIWATLDPFLEPGPVWGRKVANEQFLRALLSLDPFDAYHFFLATPKQAQDFRMVLAKNWPALAAEKRLQVFQRQTLPQVLTRRLHHCFHLSDCINHPPALARLRNTFSPDIFPITSVTHSLSYPNYPARFLDHLWPGCTPRDCIVATSEAGKSAMKASFQLLRDRFGLDRKRFPQPRIEVVPLGMNEPFPWEQRAQLRQKGRRQIEASPEQCVMLILGRVSPHSKMDMLPVLRAWQRAFPPKTAQAMLVVAGWVDPGDDFPGKFQHLSRNVGLPCRIVSRPDEQAKQELYAAADLFISLADNPQETFGLTLLEASLAGLPVIASDYSGYRDLVEHGQTGLLIPTWGPQDSGDADALAGLIPEYEIQFHLAQQTAICVPDLADALHALCSRSEMRKSMGERGRQHVLTHFSWPKVIQDYLALWDRLRQQDIPQPCPPVPRPLELSYTRMFSSFPSSILLDTIQLRLTKTGGKILRGDDFPVIYAGLEHFVSMNFLRPLLFFARKPQNVAQLKQKLGAVEPQPSDWQIAFCIQWALKHDLLEIYDN